MVFYGTSKRKLPFDEAVNIDPYGTIKNASVFSHLNLNSRINFPWEDSFPVKPSAGILSIDVLNK